MVDHNHPTSLNQNYPELARNLRSGEISADDLFDRASVLLEQTGQKAVINNVPGFVTKYAHEMTLDDTIVYARIARYADGEDTKPGFIVFDETADSNVAVSHNPSALSFRTDIDGRMSVFTNDGITPISDERYIKLVRDVINDIAQQHAANQAHVIAQRDARRQAIKTTVTKPFKRVTEFYADNRYDNRFGTRGKARAVKTAAVVAIGSSLYAPQMATNFDARIGIIPMPQPIEALVDWNNAADHKAQGFSRPEGAAPVIVGQPIDHIPLLGAYDTNDTPDASYNGLDIYKFDESRPGLYASNFDPTYHPEHETCSGKNGDHPCYPESAVFGADGCYTVLGDFHTGMTEVFTQTPDLDGKITIEAKNTKSMEICLTNPQDTATNGTIYIYQNQ